RSATPPRVSDPTAMPMSSIVSTQPSDELLMCHSVEMPGEAKLGDRTTNPSRAFRPMVMTTATICSRAILELAIVWRGSVFTGESLAFAAHNDGHGGAVTAAASLTT